MEFFRRHHDEAQFCSRPSRVGVNMIVGINNTQPTDLSLFAADSGREIEALRTQHCIATHDAIAARVDAGQIEFMEDWEIISLIRSYAPPSNYEGQVLAELKRRHEVPAKGTVRLIWARMRSLSDNLTPQLCVAFWNGETVTHFSKDVYRAWWSDETPIKIGTESLPTVPHPDGWIHTSPHPIPGMVRVHQWCPPSVFTALKAEEHEETGKVRVNSFYRGLCWVQEQNAWFWSHTTGPNRKRHERHTISLRVDDVVAERIRRQEMLRRGDLFEGNLRVNARVRGGSLVHDDSCSQGELKLVTFDRRGQPCKRITECTGGARILFEGYSIFSNSGDTEYHALVWLPKEGELKFG